MKMASGRVGLLAALMGVVGVGAFVALAQDFKGFRSTSARSGLPTVSSSTPGGSTPVDYNDAGRAFLRWWNPTRTIRTNLDNDQTYPAIGTSPGGVTAQNPAASWSDPASLSLPVLAFNYYQATGISQPYRLTKSVAQTAATTDPRSGATRVYSWTFTDLIPGEGYRVSLSIPLGPTQASIGSVNVGDYPQRFYVADVQGDVAGTDIEVIDTFSVGGGFVRLGNEGQSTDKVFVPNAAGTLTINLYNTAPRDSQGLFLDQDALPGVQWVYADAARVEQVSTTSGGMTAQPITMELDGSTAPTPGAQKHRTMAARNESLSSGRLSRQVGLATISSYLYNGATADPGEPVRLNMAWSWPVARARNNSAAEGTRYAVEREDWIFGPVAGNERHTFRSQQDNSFSQVTAAGGGFITSSDGSSAGFFGGDYYLGTSVNGADASAATSEVRYEANVPNGSYRVQVYIPSGNTRPDMATRVIYELYAGATLLDTFEVSQATPGWITPLGQPAEGYAQSDATGPLMLRVTNVDRAAAGVSIIADGIRWVAPADLTVSSTPVAATTDVAVAVGTTQNRDVVVVPMEDGRIYAVDAVGDSSTGDAPQTFWSWPSDNPATDPNRVLTQDGQSTELPTGFNSSSGLIETVGGRSVFYIASENGRIYALDVEGRGDGTTERVWSWPNDYNPTNPLAARQAPEPDQASSVTYGEFNGTPAIYVLTGSGFLYVLDAAGDAATRTTTVLFSRDLVAEPLTTTPVYDNGVLYVNYVERGTTDGRVAAISGTDGSIIWTSTEVYAPFGQSGMVLVPASQITGTGPAAGLDALFVADSSGRVSSLDPATGALRWDSTEIASGASGGLGFTYLTVRNNGGLLENEIASVLVPTNGGALVALYADGSLNSRGTRRVWQYNLERGPATSPATGGWRTTDLLSWIYIGDADGTLYAFNGNDNINPGVITPGEVPGSEEVVENDPEFDDLDGVINASNFRALSPDGYTQLQQGLLDGTMTNADVVNIATNESINRRTFEYGETLYLLIHSLPTLSSGDYSIELIMSSTNGPSTVRRQVPIRPISPTIGTGPNTRLWIAVFPLLPNSNGMPPGTVNVRVRAIASQNRRLTSQEVLLPYSDTNPLVEGNLRISNPLAVEFPRSDALAGLLGSRIGATTDAYNARAAENGSGGVDTATVPGPRPESEPTVVLPGGYFGPDLNSTGDLVPHSTAGTQRMNILDRSLSFLIFGPNRGLPNVRMAGNDLQFQVLNGGVLAPTRNTYKPLSLNGVAYPNFEDLPGTFPNRSLDYPDLARSALSAAKTRLSRTENPLYDGVTLVPPTATNVDLTTYRTAAGFDTQLVRTLAPTPVDVSIQIPRYQPASGPANAAAVARPGYRGVAQVFLDTNNAIPGYDSSDAHRRVALGLRVAPDERLRVGTPVLDLGSVPGGAGFNGGAVLGGPGGRGVAEPGSGDFNPANNDFANQFRTFPVFNDGNVNLLNVRLGRSERLASGSVLPFRLGLQGGSSAAWLHPARGVISDLDNDFSPTSTIDASARVFLQKARPGDLVPTRLSTNPVRRANSNFGVTSGTLLDSILFPTGDPKVGLVIPPGSPSGQYRGTLFVIEDDVADGILGSRFIGLPVSVSNLESYSDPGLTLNFNVRESRLTNRPTQYSSPMIDNLVTGTENFAWSNSQPTMARRASGGSLAVAFTSNRLENTGLPGFLARARVGADTAEQNRWRVYLATMSRNDPAGLPVNLASRIQSQMNFLPDASNARWFRHETVFPDAAVANPENSFSLPTGWTIDASTMAFSSPALPSSGFMDALNPTQGTNPYILDRGFTYIAFLGTAKAVDGNGNTKEVSQIFLSRFSMSDSGAVTVEPVTGGNRLLAVPGDPFVRKSAPSLTQNGTVGHITYTAYAGNLGQPTVTTFTGADFSTPAPFRTGGFDSVGAPSSVLRLNQQGFVAANQQARLDTVFPARRRGKSNSEVFLSGMTSGLNASFGTRGQQYFLNRVDELTRDSTTGTYWAPGAAWRVGASDLDYPGGGTVIDLFILDSSGFRSILNKDTANYDSGTGMLTGSTTLGGRAALDTQAGFVRLTGVVLPASGRLFVRYSPACLSIGASADANYRSASMVWDARFPNVDDGGGFSDLSISDELAYWHTSTHGPVGLGDRPRGDRYVLGLSRTSGDGTQTARPYYSSLRYGVQLSAGVLTSQNAADFGLVSAGTFQVTNWGGVPADEQYYQIDPISGRVYFLNSAEGRTVTIRFQAVDASGRSIGQRTETVTVQLYPEIDEQPIPIEQAANESGVSLSLEHSVAGLGSRPVSGFWTIWSSTRGGTTDLFFQSLMPRFQPAPPTR